jgi:hypothetical protein
MGGRASADPSRTQDRLLPPLLKQKTEDVEDAGFQCLAVTLRGLADSYDREAERIIADHK